MATSNAIKSQGVKLQSGDGGSPEVFLDRCDITSIDGPGGEAAEIDVTHLCSTAKEFLIGLPDEGNITLEGNLVPTDTGQTRLRTDRVNATKRNYKIILTDSPATMITFAAYVKGFKISAGVDTQVKVSITLRVTGALTWT